MTTGLTIACRTSPTLSQSQFSRLRTRGKRRALSKKATAAVRLHHRTPRPRSKGLESQEKEHPCHHQAEDPVRGTLESPRPVRSSRGLLVTASLSARYDVPHSPVIAKNAGSLPTPESLVASPRRIVCHIVCPRHRILVVILSLVHSSSIHWWCQGYQLGRRSPFEHALLPDQFVHAESTTD
jgi:hypothetical protein